MSSRFVEAMQATSAASDESPRESLVLEIDHVFSTIAATARQGIRERAASIHPDLQPLGYNVLWVLAREQALRQIRLAEELHVDKATISRVIQWLEAEGLVVRAQDPQDDRALLVSITDAARAGFVASNTASRHKLRHILSSWEPGEIKILADLLSKLNNSD